MSNLFAVRNRLRVSIILIFLSLGSWIALLTQADLGMLMGIDTQAHGRMIGLSAPELFLFLGLWIVMTTAMMLPSAAPMITTYAAMLKQRVARDQLWIPAWIFAVGYLAAWSVFGLLAYAAYLFSSMFWMDMLMTQSSAVLLAAMAVTFAGIYQLTPLKFVCLSRCRTPLGFLLHHWREGRLGALRMGIDHGLYCVGCCWALMVILFVVGLMNIAWMALLTMIIFVEKVSSQGLAIGKVFGASLIVAGVALATIVYL